MGARINKALEWLGFGYDLNSEVTEAAGSGTAKVVQGTLPDRRGYEYGIPDGGLDEWNFGGITGNDRRAVLNQLYEAYRTCPWAWAAVNAIARTITAGGLVTDYTADDEDGDQEIPPKPPAVLGLERLLLWCNEREDIRQLLRGVIIDLLIFGDAYLEVVWLAGIPVALYSLDAPSMYPVADKHGRVSGYVQLTEMQQRAEFEEHEVIHISLDSPRSGVYGISPTEAALLPITTWLFCSATVKETFRKGNPPNIHVDFPQSMDKTEINRWVAQYLARNLGPRNIGTPIPTKGGASVHELKQGSLAEYLTTKDQARDEILATFGVPPAEAGVIETGNIGGGTGESQRKTFLSNTCSPIAELVLEKIVYAIVRQGFGIVDWTLKFAEVDLRDSKTVEEIRDKRVRNGTWTINRARAEVGEPPVDGGDDPAIISGGAAVLVRDLVATSQAAIAAKLRGSALEPDEPKEGEGLVLIKPEPEPVPDALAPFAGQDGADPADPDAVAGDQAADDPAGLNAKDGKKVKVKGKGKPTEVLDADLRAVDEAWVMAYRQRRQQALAELSKAA